MPTDIIQWYPGHMAKTGRLIRENLKSVDAVIEIRDARIPLSSKNPDIDKLTRGRPRLVLLNKTDLCDRSELPFWLGHITAAKNVMCLAVDCKTGEGIGSIPGKIKELCAEKLSSYESKGMRGRRLRVLVLGIPNVGKSTLINRLAGRAKAKAEDRPGVTRDTQIVSTGYGIDLVDTPGILWPAFDKRVTAENLAISGAIKDEVTDTETVALALVNRLRRRYEGLLRERYRIEGDIADLSDYDLFCKIARSRGFMMKGGEPDLNRCSASLLFDLRNGKTGRITLDFPEDFGIART